TSIINVQKLRRPNLGTSLSVLPWIRQPPKRLNLAVFPCVRLPIYLINCVGKLLIGVNKINLLKEPSKLMNPTSDPAEFPVNAGVELEIKPLCLVFLNAKETYILKLFQTPRKRHFSVLYEGK